MGPIQMLFQQVEQNVFGTLVFDVVMANNYDVSGDHDGNLSSNLLNINDSFDDDQQTQK